MFIDNILHILRNQLVNLGGWVGIAHPENLIGFVLYLA